MHGSKFFCMEILHGVNFVFKEINSRDASVSLSGSKQSHRCFVPNMSPFWMSMVDRDWSQGKYSITCKYIHNTHIKYITAVFNELQETVTINTIS